MKSGYKQTDVGVIPEEWEVSPFGDVFSITAGGDFDPKRSQSFHDEIHCHPIYSNALTNYGLYGYCSYADHPAGSITITARGMVGGANFRDHPYTAIGRVLVLQPKSEVAGIYFAEVINNRVKFANESTGVPQLTAPQISKYRLPAPPLPEQRAIAEALSDVDALLGALGRLIAKKRDLKQAAMQQLLTGQTRLPGFYGEWQNKRLGTLLRFQVGFPFSSAFFNEKGEGIRLVKNRDLKSDDQLFYYNGKYEEAFVVHDGDVLVGMDGDFLPCMWCKGRALLNQRVGRIVPNAELNGAFAYYHLIKPLKEIEIVTSSTTVKHLSHGDIEGIECPMPPLPEQTAIAGVLAEMDAELAGLEQQRVKTRALKQAMMQELLTGRTRLV